MSFPKVTPPQNGFHPDGIGVRGRHAAREKPGVRDQSRLRQAHPVRFLDEAIRRFVEADMPVEPDPEQLQIDPAEPSDQMIVACALGVGILRRPVRNKRVLGVNIDLTEEVFAHKARVTSPV